MRKGRRNEFWRRGKTLGQVELRTALEWIVFTSSRTARLELTKVLDAGKNMK